MANSPDIIICGAGIIGICCAYHLAVRHGLKRILLVDERSPLSLTSDKSSECYRNWWPDQAMVFLMNRSIDLMEELADQTGNAFHLNRRGYLYITEDERRAKDWLHLAQRISKYGGGPLRIHNENKQQTLYQPSPVEGFDRELSGADIILDPKLLRKNYPYISTRVIAGLHVRRAGWFSAQQLGMILLEQARAYGVELVKASITGINTRGGRVRSIELDNMHTVGTGAFINAAGPLIPNVLRLLDVSPLPVVNELHLKAVINDSLNIVPRDAPLLIWSDPQVLNWSEDESAFLADEADMSWLLDELPPGGHTRPEGPGNSQSLLLLWQYRAMEKDAVWPIPVDMQYAEIVLRGLTSMLPGLRGYLDKLPRAMIDGGYYTHTPENRPLIGPLAVKGAFACGAFSGYGVMAACGAGEILAAHLIGSSLPPIVDAFSPARYDDPAYMEKVRSWGETGQL